MSSRTHAKLVLQLPAKVAAELVRRAEAENCPSTSEFVAKMFLEKLEKEEASRLSALLIEGLNSGPAVPADKEFWSKMKKRVRARVAASTAARQKALKAK